MNLIMIQEDYFVVYLKKTVDTVVAVVSMLLSFFHIISTDGRICCLMTHWIHPTHFTFVYSTLAV